MFETHFSFLSTTFMKNVNEFNYSLLADDKILMTRHEIIKVIYEINLKKHSKLIKLLVKRCNCSLTFLSNKYIFFSINTSRRKFNHCILTRFLQ